MIYDFMQLFNEKWQYIDNTPEDYIVEDSGTCYRIIIKNTCEWYSRGGGCTMCNYSQRTGIHASDNLKKYQEQIIAQIANFQNKYDVVKIYINGSFFNNNELDSDTAIGFLKILHDELKINTACVESRIEYITKEIVSFYSTKSGIKFKICVGIESTNETIRNIAIHKNTSIDELYKLYEDIKSICSLKVYLLIKPPFVTEGQAIEDVVNSIEELVKHGITNISYTPVAVQKNTIVEFLLQEHLYRPVWIWSLIEINTQLKELLKTYPSIQLSGLDYYPRPVQQPFNCEHCSEKILNKLIENRRLVWEDIVKEDHCTCVERWRRELNQSANITIEEQVENAFLAFQKNINRSKNICQTLDKSKKEDILLTDVAKLAPLYNIALDFVGVRDMKMPLSIKGFHECIADYSYAIALDEFHRGIHMSRLVEVIDNFSIAKHTDIIGDILNLVKNYNVNCEAEIHSTLIRRATNKATTKNNFNSFETTINAKHYVEPMYKDCLMFTIKVPFINACPCTKQTVYEALGASYTHTQRGYLSICFCNVMVPSNDLFSFIERYIGIYDILKREDEMKVVKDAHDNAQFCEDICREVSFRLAKKFFGTGDYADITVITEESIHPHQAYSCKRVVLK